MLRFNSSINQIEHVEKLIIPVENEVTWFDLKSQDQVELIESLDIHPHAKQTLLAFPKISKINEYKNEAVLCLSAINNQYETTKVNILAGKNYVITLVEDNEPNLFRSIVADFKEEPLKMSHTGHILYHLLNKIISGYLSAVDEIADEILELEKKVFKDPFENKIGKDAYKWKVRLHDLRQIIEPQGDVLKKIGREDFPYLNEDSHFYFQDLESDHERIVGALDTFKENLLSIYNLQMSLKADHTNAVMKTLTLVSVIFIPMTFLAGLYGMNFENMPELKWRFGYGGALAVMFGIGVTIASYFRIKGWWGKNEQK